MLVSLGSRVVVRSMRENFGQYVHHVTDTTGGQSVQAGTNTLDGDDVQVTGTGVVCAVHDGTTVSDMLSASPSLSQAPYATRCLFEVVFRSSISRKVAGENIHWETQGHLELATGGTTTVNAAVSANISLPVSFILPSVDFSVSISCSHSIFKLCGVRTWSHSVFIRSSLVFRLSDRNFGISSCLLSIMQAVLSVVLFVDFRSRSCVRPAKLELALLLSDREISEVALTIAWPFLVMKGC